MVVPLYLAEMAPAYRRGRMVTINEFMIVTGQLLAFVVNTIIDQTIQGAHVWRVMLTVAAIPAIVPVRRHAGAAGHAPLVRGQGSPR